MKNKKLLLALLLAVVLLAFWGCKKPDTLDTPLSVQVSKSGLITWQTVPNATGYKVKINDQEYTTVNSFYQAPDVSKEFSATVTATAEGYNDSAPSVGVKFTPQPVVDDEPPVLTARSPYDKQEFIVADDEWEDYDYTTLFSIKKDGQALPVLQEYLDKTDLTAEGGIVVCSAYEQEARIKVAVITRVYELSLDVDRITLYVDEVNNYDFLSMFHATTDGVTVTLSRSTVTTDVQAAVGQYSYSVTYHGVTKTLKVTVIDKVEIKPLSNHILITDIQLLTYDFTREFSITVNGYKIPVKAEYIDKSQLESGKIADVICKYGDKTCAIWVQVSKTQYSVTLSTDEITIHTSRVGTYDFNKLFSASINGKAVEITSAMVQNNVKPQAGDYTYVVTLGSAVGSDSKTLTVHVTDEHQVQIVVNYPDLQIVKGETEFDFTSMFSLYVDETPVPVTVDMVDTSAVDSAETGETADVTLTYTDDNGKAHTKTATVSIVDSRSLSVQPHDAVTYVNGPAIDLKSLFTVSVGGVNVPVTDDMVNGSVDYSRQGDNAITCTYGGVSATANVKVQLGVIIEKRADVIEIRRGTDIETYFFGSDFNVSMNGVKVDDITPFLNIDGVDFNTVGSYTVTLTVVYNVDQVIPNTTSTAPSDKVSKKTETITYRVVERTSEITLIQQVVNVNKNDVYNAFTNLTVKIDGKGQSLVTDKNSVDAVCCYAEVVKPVDTGKTGVQTTQVAVYVNGVNAEPRIVEFAVNVRTTAVITSRDAVIFVGDTLYTADLFTITDNGVNVPVTENMVSGHVDVFNSGVYQVEMRYDGSVNYASVVVFAATARGSYSTLMTTIATEADEDEEGNTTQDAVPSRRYGPMSIGADGQIVIDGRTVKILRVIDEQTLAIAIGSDEYTMHMFDGIVVLDPDNSLRLEFRNTKRPLVYFNDSVWTLDENTGKLIVNYGSQHVIATSFTSYTIEVFTATKADGTIRKFALYVRLVSKMNSHTDYRVTWGDAVINDGFEQKNGETGVLTYDGESYTFDMTGNVTGKVNRDAQKNLFAGMRFTNPQDKNASLSVSSNGTITYRPNASTTISVAPYEQSTMKNGVFDYVNNTILIYETDASSASKWYCYKFIVDPVTKTFTMPQRDSLYGFYSNDKGYVFLDGYGKGELSFNRGSYVTIQFTYEADLLTNELRLTYFNHYAYPEYGNEAVFHIGQTLNLLTCTECAYDGVKGLEFVNTHIIDGAIVRFNTKDFTGSTFNTVYDNTYIETADGVLDRAAKKAVMNVTAIDRYQNGLYQVTVKVSVGGQERLCYYLIQTYVPITPAPVLARDYGNSVIAGKYALSVDVYGRATIVGDGETFAGDVKYYGNDRFVVRAASGSKRVTLKASLISEGILEVTCNGAINFRDFYTTGVTDVTGNSVKVLHKITVNGVNTFVLRDAISASGSIVSVQAIGGNIYQAGDTVIKILNWGDVSKGLEVSDSVRGTYVNGNDELTLDGFGEAVLNGSSGSYSINQNRTVTVELGDTVAVYRLNGEQFADAGIILDNSLLNGKRFSASHMFYCGDDEYPDSYMSDTTFMFRNGVVTAISTSLEHDANVDGCNKDTYSPTYASREGVDGTYEVTGNKLTVTLNGCVFRFLISDVTRLDKIVTLSTTLSMTDHGYFSTGTVFVNG